MKNFSCFDIGGTFIKYGIVREDGVILTNGKFKTPNSNCCINIPKILIEYINKIRKSYSIESVGISTAGQVDSIKGEIIYATDNLPNYTGTKLSKIIENETGLKCSVENDVNAAALGEMWKGAGVNKKNFVCITLGTGIGGALIIGGRLYRGTSGIAGEIGHIIINEGGEKCTCGGRGCFERYASTSTLVRNYKKESETDGNIDGEKILQKVKDGNEIAIKVYDEFLNHIVTGLLSITYILNPELIIVGGGISNQGKPFFDEINRRFKQRGMESFTLHTQIVQAKLANDAGLIGACYLAKCR